MGAAQPFVNAAVRFGIIRTPALTGQHHDFLYACSGHINPLKQPGKKFLPFAFRLGAARCALSPVQAAAVGAAYFLQGRRQIFTRHSWHGGSRISFGGSSGQGRPDFCHLRVDSARIRSGQHHIHRGPLQLRVRTAKGVDGHIRRKNPRPEAANIAIHRPRLRLFAFSRKLFPCAAGQTTGWKSVPRSASRRTAPHQRPAYSECSDWSWNSPACAR